MGCQTSKDKGQILTNLKLAKTPSIDCSSGSSKRKQSTNNGKRQSSEMSKTDEKATTTNHSTTTNTTATILNNRNGSIACPYRMSIAKQSSQQQLLNQSQADPSQNGNGNGTLLSKMTIAELDIKLVRSSWKELQQTHDLKTCGINMMVKIFLKHPEVKHIWKFAATLKLEQEMRESAQLRSHGNNVFEAVNAAVNCLDKIEALNFSLVELGRRHSRYGAMKSHFPIITSALIETISEALGPKFTDEHLQAWTKVTKFFVELMSTEME